MLICIDSNQFIFGIAQTAPDSVELLRVLRVFEVAIPRLVVQEVTRNLRTPGQVKMFYRLLRDSPRLLIVEEPVPAELVTKYAALGLPEKADAVIGAFAEWVGAKYLISDNRHFLKELKTEAYEVLTPGEFLERYRERRL
jgi:predicted nucleic acid-binding protein